MRLIKVFILVFGVMSITQAQNDIISVSKSAFYYYDGYPMKIASPTIPINLAYEHIIDEKYGLKVHVNMSHDIYYDHGFENDRDLAERYTNNISAAFKRYYSLSPNLKYYPIGILDVRTISESWQIPTVNTPHIVGYENTDIGIGIGAGIQYRFFNIFMVEAEVTHTEYIVTLRERHEYVTDAEGVGNTGSKHQLRINLSVGVLF